LNIETISLFKKDTSNPVGEADSEHHAKEALTLV
jgi:hypothetical protein